MPFLGGSFRVTRQRLPLFVEQVVAQHLLKRDQQMTLLALADVELDRHAAGQRAARPRVHLSDHQ